MEKIFAHFDIKADGTSPATSNMLSIGIVFTDINGKVIKDITIDLLPREGYVGDTVSINWWLSDERRRENYLRILREGLEPSLAMQKFSDCLDEILQLSGIKNIIWVAYPLSYDLTFLQCYIDLYLDNVAISNALCLDTIVKIWKKHKDIEKYFKKWTENIQPKNHSIDNAYYQASIFHGIMTIMDSR